jgi:ABC-2 type transport system ATP-binding protein
MNEAGIAGCDNPMETRVPEPGAEEIVLVDSVTKDFGGKKAVKDLSFSVPAGQICGLLGPNGAGKTTLFRLLMGILKATRGRLLVDGLDAFEDRVEAKRRIGYLPDEPIFYAYLSAREILELSAAMHGTAVRVG